MKSCSMASISSSCNRAGRGTPARRPVLLRTELMILRFGMYGIAMDSGLDAWKAKYGDEKAFWP
eukprot:2006025-Prymnesium_polylepis.1